MPLEVDEHSSKRGAPIARHAADEAGRSYLD